MKEQTRKRLVGIVVEVPEPVDKENDRRAQSGNWKPWTVYNGIVPVQTTPIMPAWPGVPGIRHSFWGDSDLISE